MEDVKKQIDFVFDGLFYLLGFTKNPTQKEIKSILEKSSADKIKLDIKRINKNYRNKYLEMRKEVLHLD